MSFKKALKLLTCSTLLWTSSLLAASKFGIVNMQKVILTVEEGKAERGKLETEIKAKEKELMKKKQELDKMNGDWQKQAALLSEQAKMAKQKEFQQKFLELRQDEMKFQQEIKRKEQEATQKIAIKVAKYVDRIAKAKKIEAVFETNTSGLLYIENPIDLTDDVIKAYDTAKDKVSKNDKKKSKL